MRSYSAVVCRGIVNVLFFVYSVSRLFYKGTLMCCSNFRFSVFSPFVFRALFYFFLFQAVDCLLNRTRVSDVVEKGTGAPTVEDTGADTNLGPASERKLKAPLSPPPGASKASQNNDNCSSWQCYLPCF